MADSRFYKNKGPFSLERILEISGVRLNEDQSPPHDLWIKDVGVLDTAQEGEISFCLDKYRQDLSHTKTSLCFVRESLKENIPPTVFPLYTEAPLRAFAEVAAAFYPDSRVLPTLGAEYSIKSQACFIHPTAQIGKNVILEPGVVIHEGAEISDHVQIGSQTIIGPHVVVGEGTRIAPHVSLFFALIGKRVIIGPGTRIGQEGFGFVTDEKGFIALPHLGRVILEDGVEIGANCTIDRGSLKDTFIGAQTRIDNLVQIAHNVTLGRGCIIVAQVGIAGSTVLGDYVAAGGQAGFADHLKIGSRARIAAQSGLMRDVAEGETVAGTPAVAILNWHKQNATLSRLIRNPSLRKEKTSQ
ncbi:MAG: UDP-3-O-(3-hydroxymyristoyl)glucosamine N-acyltransferase [Proteobacteria bacterium]|nr:UDP-3-O-(3-hydroxymyristoyl)glucosamine N-acyltransferase [Pseudomonadota bacterium]